MNNSSANPFTFPLEFAKAKPIIGRLNVARPIKVINKPPNPIAAVIAIGRSPRIVSTKESEVSTPTSININKKSIITAPV